MNTPAVYTRARTEQPRVVERLKRWSATPPQVLLLEGGSAAQREALALTWAAVLNCVDADGPCFSCRTCMQIADKVFQDLCFFDGAQEKIKIQSVRDVRELMGQPPKGEGKRVIVLAEAQELTLEAANALLKSMEEPAPDNVFVLLAPQRERLLPTLVSRSWVLTLGWGEPPLDEDALEWIGHMLRFSRSGRDWFHRTGVKNSVDTQLVQKILQTLQAGLVSALTGKSLSEPFASAWNGLDRESLLRVAHLIDLAQENLVQQVNPVLVLEWLAIQLWEQRNG